MKLKTTKEQAYEIFRVYNEKFNLDYNDVKTDVPELYADITYKSENFTSEYSEAERTYRVTNRSGKRFFNMPSGSRSVYGNSLDGSDVNVRLDIYYDWTVEKCELTIPDEVLRLIYLKNASKYYLNLTIELYLLHVLVYGFYGVFKKEDGKQ